MTWWLLKSNSSVIVKYCFSVRDDSAERELFETTMSTHTCHTTRRKTIVTVINISAELSLIDNDITTYLMVFDEGWRFFYMIAYIYVPVPMPFLRVILDTSGLSCTSQLTVYHPISTFQRQGIKVNSVIRNAALSRNDTLTASCSNASSCVMIFALLPRWWMSVSGRRNYTWILESLERYSGWLWLSRWPVASIINNNRIND